MTDFGSVAFSQNPQKMAIFAVNCSTNILQKAMATFKAEVYAHQKKKDGTYNIKIRITHNQQKKYLATPYYITKEDITQKTFKIKNQYYIDKVDEIIKRYRRKCDNCGELIKTMTVDQVVNLITAPDRIEKFDLDIVAYGRKLVKKLNDTGHKGNALTYVNALNSLVKFAEHEVISIHEITTKFVKDWIEWIKAQPARSNRKKGDRAQSLYPSNIRALHNLAKEEFNNEDQGIIRIPLSPFKKLPKVSQPRKRALDVKQLRKLIDLEYTTILQPGNNRFNLAKDVFLLSFGLVGMNAVDLYYCDNYKNGRITYQRTKTKNRRSDKAEISIKVEKEIKPLFDKYRDPKGVRVFGFYNWYSSVDAFTAALNIGLKKIGDLLGVDDLEFYAARHTWATLAANDAGVDKFTVHTALNHVDEKMKVTDLYIRKSWDPIDKANQKVLKYVKVKLGSVDEPKGDKFLLRQKVEQMPKQKDEQNL